MWNHTSTTQRSPPTPTVEISDVSVWFGPKVALSELSCSFGPGVTGLLGPNGAGKTTLMRAMTGLIGVNQGTVRIEGRNPRTRPSGSRPNGVGAGGRSRACRTHRSAVRRATSPTLPRRRARRHPIRRWQVSRCSTTVIVESTVSARECGNEPRSPPLSSTDPQVLVLDEPLNGADPVQRLHLIDLFKKLGLGWTNGDRQFARAERSRAHGRAGDRVDARTACRGRRPTGDSRCDGRPTAARARSFRRRPPVGGIADRPRIGCRRHLRHLTRRTRDPDRASPRPRRRHCRVWRANRRYDSSRFAPSTTLSRASSGSWCDDRRPDAAAPVPVTPRRPRSRFVAIFLYTLQSCVPPKRWAAVLAAVRRCAAVRLARPRRPPLSDQGASLRQRRGRGDLLADDADRRARDRRLRARSRGARRHLPLHLALADANLADHRSDDGWAAQRSHS